MKILMMTSLIMLNSCTITGRPYIKPTERCGYSAKFDKCRCVMYDLYNAKKQGEGYDMPAEYCDDVIGFKAGDWLKRITPWAKRNIRSYDDSQDK